MNAYQFNYSIKQIKEIAERYQPNFMLFEFPDRTQDSLSAIALGMCWGSTFCIFDDFYIASPSLLKNWSDSKKGDKKKKVKEMVKERVSLKPKQISNDNIVDAVGLALIALEQAKYCKSTTL